MRDLALVESAEVRFGPGLNLLTGETGSGKSLIIDALGLALGARASTDQVRHGAERAVVDAAFADGLSELVLTREVGRRGAARIDGRPAAPGQLRESARRLVAVHGQHEHQALMDTEAQTDLLDAFAGSQALRAAVADAHERWTEAADRLSALERARNRGDREREYMALQLEELTQAGLREGEDVELAAERAVARHATRLHELSGSALLALSADEGLPRAVSEVRAAAELDGRLGGLAERLAGLEEEVADASSELRRYAEGIDSDPRRLEAVEERLSLLESIKRRYGGALSEAIAERDRLAAQLGEGEDLASAIESARARAAADRADLLAAAAGLTRERERASRSLSEAVAAELQGLHLEGARFEVRLEPRPEVGPAGAEQVLMQFSANPGEPLAALARVASGGELARVMLAIKTATAAADSIPTLVFDEVDAGIGGEAALQVGLRLKALGGRHQVLVVTHLPQVACFADHHLLVEKAPGGDGRNVVRVRELDDDRARAAELARMMSGRVTDKALARALELLEEARGA